MELLYIMMLVILAEVSFLTFRSIKDTQESNKKRTNTKIFVDTSTLIDGRILALAQSGFLSGEVLIPRSVIRELQLLADGSDSQKRSRARYGMDVANELERCVMSDVSIFMDDISQRVKVDERLLELAKKYKATIMTNDFNLGKVAAIEKIKILNINDLAMSLRNEFFPGEKFTLKVISAGNEPRQGIGHLPDGTMVVIENATKHVGKEVEVEFIRSLQTSAGKMMFAKLTNEAVSRHNRKGVKRNKSKSKFLAQTN